MQQQLLTPRRLLWRGCDGGGHTEATIKRRDSWLYLMSGFFSNLSTVGNELSSFRRQLLEQSFTTRDICNVTRDIQTAS